MDVTSEFSFGNFQFYFTFIFGHSRHSSSGSSTSGHWTRRANTLDFVARRRIIPDQKCYNAFSFLFRAVFLPPKKYNNNSRDDVHLILAFTGAHVLKREKESERDGGESECGRESLRGARDVRYVCALANN